MAASTKTNQQKVVRLVQAPRKWRAQRNSSIHNFISFPFFLLTVTDSSSMLSV